MKSKFYYFPYRRKVPYIMYKDRRIFKTKIFTTLYNQLGANTLHLLLRKKYFISYLFEQIPAKYNSTYCTVPDKCIKLIYYGYDSVIHFSFDPNNEVNEIYKQTETFDKESFLGYSLNIFDIDELIGYDKT